MPRRLLPHRIETARVCVRRYAATDAPALHEVTIANREHLVPWMPWAEAEPQPLENHEALIRYFEQEFEAARDFTYGMFDLASGEFLGGTGFHVRGDALEIGYWISSRHEGRGLVSEVSAALARVAIEYLVDPRIELVNDPANVRSGAVPRRLGFAHLGFTQRAHSDDFPDLLPTELWALSGPAFAQSAAASYPRPHLFDVGGHELAWPEAAL